jgi:hypothetical protein
MGTPIQTWTFTAPCRARLELRTGISTLIFEQLDDRNSLAIAATDDHRTYIRLDSGQVSALVQFLKTGTVE